MQNWKKYQLQNQCRAGAACQQNKKENCQKSCQKCHKESWVLFKRMLIKVKTLNFFICSISLLEVFQFVNPPKKYLLIKTILLFLETSFSQDPIVSMIAKKLDLIDLKYDRQTSRFKSFTIRSVKKQPKAEWKREKILCTQKVSISFNTFLYRNLLRAPKQ